MTDLKKLRELAEGETPTLSYADNAPYWEYILATNPQAIIELLDRLERLESCIKKEIHRCGDWKEGREALEGGK